MCACMRVCVLACVCVRVCVYMCVCACVCVRAYAHLFFSVIPCHHFGCLPLVFGFVTLEEAKGGP